jgi:hypothetical protein
LINKNVTIIKKLLENNLQITRQAVEAKKRGLIKLIGPMSDLEAYSVLCHQNGVDTSKFLTPEEAKHVRETYQAMKVKIKEPIIEKIEENESLNGLVQKVVKKSPKIRRKEPLLPASIIEDAKNMSKIYTELYIFENSLRLFICFVMEKKYGIDWWNLLDTPKAISMRNGAIARIADETRNPWHGKRGRHPIFFTDLFDFVDFIDEKWPDFKPFFPNKEWIKIRISEISRSRNCVDHHNPIQKNDQMRLEVYFNDWYKQIGPINLI